MKKVNIYVNGLGEDFLNKPTEEFEKELPISDPVPVEKKEEITQSTLNKRLSRIQNSIKTTTDKANEIIEISDKVQNKINELVGYSNILCKYNVTDTSSEVRLFYVENGSGSGSGDGEETMPPFSEMIVDGSSQELDDQIMFDTIGEHTVEFVLNDGTTNMGDNVFKNCYQLISIEIPDSVTSIGNSVFYYCSSLTRISIPNSVTSIGDYAFYECSGLTSITIPDSVTSISESAFSGCYKLTSVIIPDSVTSIGESAFSGCSGLTSVTIPDSVTSIGDYAFYECSGLTSITIPDSVTSIGESAFSGCSGLTSVTIPDSVTLIGDSAFYHCSGLTSVIIGNSVISIGGWAFRGCSGLTSITIGNSVTNIGSVAFCECPGLTSVTLPDSVTSMGSGLFASCSGLTSITIPNSVTSIGDSAFSNCSGLTSITIGNSVTSIGSLAFRDCSSLTSITCNATTAPTITNYTFQNINTDGTLTVPSGSTGYDVWMGTGDYYLGKYGWSIIDYYSSKYFTMVVTVGGDIRWIGTSNNALSYSTDDGITWSDPSGNITLSVSEGDKVLWKGTPTPGTSPSWRGIGKFSGDTNVRYTVEGNVMSLLFGDDFKGQTSLDGKEYAFYSLFSNNKKITSAENLSLPATTLVDYCYSFMFNGCTSLTTVPELPATTLTTNCYSEMFQDCTSLTTAPELPATILASGCYSGMFRNCTSLTTAPELPVTTLAVACYNSMFQGCTSLTTAPELPATTLAEGCYGTMFSGCTSLNSIKCFATDISAYTCTANWVNGVATSGTFTKAASMSSWGRGSNGIPDGWTVQDA